MTVKELKKLLSNYPDNMEVVFDSYDGDGFYFIDGGGDEENKLHLYQE